MFMGKGSPEISIQSYESMNELNDDTLRQLVEKEREWFGYEGFGEYAVCSNQECRRVLSVDEIYGVADTDQKYIPLKELEKDGPKLPDCPDCTSPTELLIQPELLRIFSISKIESTLKSVIYSTSVYHVINQCCKAKSILLPFLIHFHKIIPCSILRSFWIHNRLH